MEETFATYALNRLREIIDTELNESGRGLHPLLERPGSVLQVVEEGREPGEGHPVEGRADAPFHQGERDGFHGSREEA